MKKIIFTLAILMLAGCQESMTNEQIIAEVKKCEQAGLRAKLFFIGYGDIPKKVVCKPKR